MDDRVLVLKLIAHIEQNLTENIGTQSLVDYSGYSMNRLRQKFFAVTGDTPSGYLRKRRLTEASKEILDGAKIVDVSLKYGFSSQDNFTTSFRSYFGVTPKEIYNMNQKYKTFIGRMREPYNIMEITGLKQANYDTTLMGCIKGAADYFDLDFTPAMLYGLTGHAFLINVHKEICCSGPYVWKREGFQACLRNVGIEWVHNPVGKDSSNEERKAMERMMRKNLESGGLGMLGFLEFQLFSGYDEEGFHFLQPWESDCPVTISNLSYNTWTECLDREGFAVFSTLTKVSLKKDVIEMVKDALTYALEFYREPEKHRAGGHLNKSYKMGFGAYENWIQGVKDGFGDKHCNLVNGNMYADCRRMGSLFFDELQEILDTKRAKDVSSELSDLYQRMSDNFDHIKELELDPKRKIELLEENLEMEHEAEPRMDELLRIAS